MVSASVSKTEGLGSSPSSGVAPCSTWSFKYSAEREVVKRSVFQTDD
jgi:hypothetical protein